MATILFKFSAVRDYRSDSLLSGSISGVVDLLELDHSIVDFLTDQSLPDHIRAGVYVRFHSIVYGEQTYRGVVCSKSLKSAKQMLKRWIDKEQ